MEVAWRADFWFELTVSYKRKSCLSTFFKKLLDSGTVHLRVIGYCIAKRLKYTDGYKVSQNQLFDDCSQPYRQYQSVSSPQQSHTLDEYPRKKGSVNKRTKNHNHVEERLADGIQENPGLPVVWPYKCQNRHHS